MIYVTGDTHGEHDIAKLFPGAFPDGKKLTRNDYLIITGDFGGGWKWRNVLIPMLKCNYYNPMVRNRSDKEDENREKANSDYNLYVITPGLRGVYSIAEIVDDSNKCPEKTLVCILYDEFHHGMDRSLKEVEDLAQSNGAIILHTLHEVADYLNEKAGGEK